MYKSYRNVDTAYAPWTRPRLRLSWTRPRLPRHVKGHVDVSKVRLPWTCSRPSWLHPRLRLQGMCPRLPGMFSKVSVDVCIHRHCGHIHGHGLGCIHRHLRRGTLDTSANALDASMDALDVSVDMVLDASDALDTPCGLASFHPCALMPFHPCALAPFHHCTLSQPYARRIFAICISERNLNLYIKRKGSTRNLASVEIHLL